MKKKVQKRPLTSLSIVALITLLLGACASAAAPRPSYAPETGYADSLEAAPMEPVAEIEEAFTGSETQNLRDATQGQIDRVVIKNANLTIVVSDPSESMDAITKLAEELDGFVVNANMYKQELESGVQVPRASITIRVPAESLITALDRIKAESDQSPLNEGLNSQDVTSEYVDLQSRLRNLENTEAQLTEIMEEANKTEDVLAVYNQLVNIRGQIEVIKGQLKYFDEASRLSSISVELVADAAVQPLTIGGWQPEGVAKEAVQALINTLKFIANAVIWIVIYLLPTLLVLYLIIFLPLSLVWKAWRKRRARRKAESIEPSPQAQTGEGE